MVRNDKRGTTMDEEPFIYTRLLGQHCNYDKRSWGEESYSADLKI